MGNKHEAAQKLPEAQFKRLIGVTKRTFGEMANVLREAYDNKHKRRGRHSSLPVEQQLLMALEYLRQYVTFAELGLNYGVCESTAQNYVVWVEDVVVKSGMFSLPGKKALLSNDGIEIVLVDVTESPIERPKKNSGDGIPAKRNGTPSKRKS
jgi:hypothetical protein